MRRPAAMLFLLAPMAWAQMVVPAGELPNVRRLFESKPGDEPLRCEVAPIPPALNFAFRFEAGYRFRVPQSQYPNSLRGWVVLTTIAPEGGDPTYLIVRTPLAETVKTGSNFDIRGYYLLGAGTYSVESTLRDDRNGVCRKHWRIVVEPSRSERAVPLGLPDNTVRPLVPITEPDTSKRDDAAPRPLTILLNAAAFSTDRTVIRERDRERVAGALTALLEHLPAPSVRVVVFSLEQQKEVLCVDSFQPPDLRQLADAIAALPQTTVDVTLLQNPHGHVEFLEGLIRRELDPPDTARTVIFLGPTSRYDDKAPRALLPIASQSHARLFYLRWERWARPNGIAPATLGLDPSNGQPDIISRVVARLDGKTIIFHAPASLAEAIRKIEGAR